MSINKEPKNIFCTSQVLSIVGVLYITTISPAIDKALAEGLTRKEIGHLINSTIVGIIAGSLKMLDKDVYTPKFIPGRNKDKAFDNINEELINPIQEVVKSAVQDVVITTVDKTINNLTTDAINSIAPNNTLVKAVVPNIVHSFTDAPIENTINNTVNDISNLFKTDQALKKNTEVIEDKYGNKYNPNLLLNKEVTNITLTSKRKTFYKFEPINSSILSEEKKIQIEPHLIIYPDSYEAINVDNHIAFNINDKTLYAYIPDIILVDNNLSIDLYSLITEVKASPTVVNNTNFLRPTIDQCEKVYDTIMKYSLYADFIKCLNTFGINTPLDVSYFLTHTAHESGGLRYMKELGDYEYFSQNYDYRNDLGNTEKGDGAKYSGVSPLQMTGRANYQAFADFIGDQKVMEGVNYVAANYSFSPSGFWWKNNDMSDFINNQNADIYDTTKRINGGLNGIEERIFYFNKCKKVFGIN